MHESYHCQNLPGGGGALNTHLIKCIWVLLILLASILDPLGLAWADPVSFAVGNQNISFDTGDASDGNVEFRTDGMYVNGIKRCDASTTELIRANIFETFHSNLTYKVFVIEDIVAHLPQHKTYSPGIEPGTGVIPNFNQLYVGPGVVLKSNSFNLSFKARTVNIEGALMTRHGAGGKGAQAYAFATAGESAKSIFVVANTVIIGSADATDASKGAIFAGWGGGGGGGNEYKSGYSVAHPGADGGSGGNVYIWCEHLINRGEIRAGNGGGGGGSGNRQYYTEAGKGGNGGNLSIISRRLSNYNIVASGYGGGGGSGDFGNYQVYGLGGYGSGGSGWYYQGGYDGGSAGAPGGGYSYDIPASAGYSGEAGYYTSIMMPDHKFKGGGSAGYFQPPGYGPGPAGGTNGICEVKADIVDSVGTLLVGYTVGGLGGNRGSEIIRLYCNTVSSIDVSRLKSQIGPTREVEIYSSSTIDGNHTLSKLYIAGTLEVKGALVCPDVRAHSAIISGAIGNFTLTSTGPVRFVNNPNYQSDAWWQGRTVIVNSLRVRGALPSASTNATGLNVVDLSGFTPLYNASGQLPTMDFAVERQVEGDSSFVEMATFNRPLSGTVQFTDYKTVILKTIAYRVGFRNPAQADKGYIYIDTNTCQARSEGNGVDSVNPTILQFNVAGGATEVTSPFVSVTLRARDDRSPDNALKAQFEVNGQTQYWDGTSFVTGQDWGRFSENMIGLNLGNASGYKTIIASIKDEAGNVATASKTVLLVLNTDQPTSTISVSGGVSGTIGGKTAVFINTDTPIITITSTAGSKIRFAFDGQPWSEWEPFAPTRELALNKSDGVVLVRIQVADNRGVPGSIQTIRLVLDKQAPVIQSLRGAAGATATKNATFSVQITATDNLPGQLQVSYSVNGGPASMWTNLGTSVSVPLSVGYNDIQIWVKDQAGNKTSKNIGVWRLAA